MTRCITCRHFTDKGDAAIASMAKLGGWTCREAPVGVYYPVLREVDCATYRAAPAAEVNRRRDWYRTYLDEHKKLKGTA
jgi:hypothetical protein